MTRLIAQNGLTDDNGAGPSNAGVSSSNPGAGSSSSSAQPSLNPDPIRELDPQALAPEPNTPATLGHEDPAVASATGLPTFDPTASYNFEPASPPRPWSPLYGAADVDRPSLQDTIDRDYATNMLNQFDNSFMGQAVSRFQNAAIPQQTRPEEPFARTYSEEFQAARRARIAWEARMISLERDANAAGPSRSREDAVSAAYARMRARNAAFAADTGVAGPSDSSGGAASSRPLVGTPAEVMAAAMEERFRMRQSVLNDLDDASRRSRREISSPGSGNSGLTWRFDTHLAPTRTVTRAFSADEDAMTTRGRRVMARQTVDTSDYPSARTPPFDETDVPVYGDPRTATPDLWPLMAARRLPNRDSPPIAPTLVTVTRREDNPATRADRIESEPVADSTDLEGMMEVGSESSTEAPVFVRPPRRVITDREDSPWMDIAGSISPPAPGGGWIPSVAMADGYVTAPQPYPQPRSRIRRGFAREDRNADEIITSGEEDEASSASTITREQRARRQRIHGSRHAGANLRDSMDYLSFLSRTRMNRQPQPSTRQAGPDGDVDMEDKDMVDESDANVAGPSHGLTAPVRGRRSRSAISQTQHGVRLDVHGDPFVPSPLPMDFARSREPSVARREHRTMRRRRSTPDLSAGQNSAFARAVAHAKGTRRYTRKVQDPVGR